MTSRYRTDMYRMKALVCEQRAIEASEPTSKQDWEELAIEWHTMANFVARADGETALIDVA
jgi:hypothetical protein